MSCDNCFVDVTSTVLYVLIVESRDIPVPVEEYIPLGMFSIIAYCRAILVRCIAVCTRALVSSFYRNIRVHFHAQHIDMQCIEVCTRLPRLVLYSLEMRRNAGIRFGVPVHIGSAPLL